jgi:hypothetical protein
MIIEPIDFRSRLRALMEMDGTVLTEDELSRMAASYPRCRGQDLWEVREYARITTLGAREYRVVRGKSVQDVYSSFDGLREAAVRTALNDLESQ